jgi:phosphoribosyl-ATP pyrophosphohydrolase
MASVEDIVRASDKRNGGRDGANRYTLESMKAHADEIAELFGKKDGHWKDECADMMIHCLVLFKREGVDELQVLELLEKRKERFMERIGGSPEII